MKQLASRPKSALAALAGAALIPFALGGCRHFHESRAGDHADHASRASDV